jgi:hypothetical protein
MTGLACSIAVTLACAGAASAQPGAGALPRSVNLFAVLCLRQLPSLEDIAKAAGFGEFAEITGEELARFQPQVPAEALRAWRFHEAGAEFVLTASRSRPDARLPEEAPELAGATNFACSLAIPPAEPDAVVLKGLTQLLGRGPSETRQEGTRLVHAWRERAAKQLSYVHYYVAAGGGGAALLSASTFIKN